MATVTYIGKASRIRIAGGRVLERLIPVELPTSTARHLSAADFEVVASPAKPKPRTPAAAKRASAHKKES